MRVMSIKALLALGVTALTPVIAHAGSNSSHYSVELNKTEVVYLPSSAGAVVVGNPEIADVSIHSSNTIFVIGRGYGETNLLVLDAAGHKIMDADIQVVNNLAAHGVRVYNGKARETYSCAPYCQPAPVLGDSQDFISSNSGTTQTITNNVAAAVPTQSNPVSFAGSGSSDLNGPPSDRPQTGF